MKKATKKRRSSKKAINLYLELLKINQELKSVKSLYDRQDELLKEIYDLDKGPQIVFEINGPGLKDYNDKEMFDDDEKIIVEVAEQNGHYVFNKPLRLSVKKVA